MTRKWARFDSETLSSPADDLTLTDQLSGQTGKEHSEFLAHDFATGGTTFNRQQYNGDTASNYSARVSLDGAGDVAVGSVPQINWDLLGVNPADHFVHQSTINLSAQEKLVLGNSMGGGIVGAGSAPNRRINAYKWVNTASQINASRYFDAGGTGQFATTTNFAAFMPIDQAKAVFASMREAFAALTTPFNQRFVETFSGSVLSSIWSQVNGGGVGSFGMVDAINEGFRITSGAGNNNNSEITFGNIKPLDARAHICIAIFRRVTGDGQDSFGVTDEASGILGSSINNQLSIFDGTNQTFKALLFNNGGSPISAINTTVPVDTVFHNYRTEGLSASATGTIDGSLEATATTDLPNGNLQPTFFVRRFSAGGGHEGRIRYAEVFNTA